MNDLIPHFVLATVSHDTSCNIGFTAYQCDAELGEFIEKTGLSVEHQL